jgi:chemotaxis protein CheX
MMKSAHEFEAASGSHESWSPLLELAVREVFRLMLSSELAAPAGDTDLSPAITSMVGMAGQLRGVLSVRCDEKSAALMASKMLGVEVSKVGADMSDAIGEVCNMIAGNFKNKIPGLGDGCLLSPPTVVTGNNYSMCSRVDRPALEIKFLFEGIPIVISLQVHS